MTHSPCRTGHAERRRSGDLPAPQCGQRPHWLPKTRLDPSPRLLCVLRPGHRSKHVNAADHRWENRR